jgi:hypothetical protein
LLLPTTLYLTFTHCVQGSGSCGGSTDNSTSTAASTSTALLGTTTDAPARSGGLQQGTVDSTVVSSNNINNNLTNSTATVDTVGARDAEAVMAGQSGPSVMPTSDCTSGGSSKSAAGNNGMRATSTDKVYQCHNSYLYTCIGCAS